MLFFLCKGRAVGPIDLCAANCVVVVVREPLLVIGQYSEALFKLLKFTAFIWTDRSLYELAVSDCLVAVLSRREHVESLVSEVPARSSDRRNAMNLRPSPGE